MTKKVEILLATYNGEKYIREQIDSILNQTHREFRLLISDDCSSDNTRSILKKNEQKDERIKVVHKKNGGLSSARNAGLALMSGDYLTEERMMLEGSVFHEGITKGFSSALNDVTITRGGSLQIIRFSILRLQAKIKTEKWFCGWLIFRS